MTLNNLANHYRTTQGMKEAEERCLEGERLLEPLWHTNPEVHGDLMARILYVRAQLCGPLGMSEKDARAVARRAFAAAYYPDIKESARALLGKFCTDDRS
jgi:hypothetical protein